MGPRESITVIRNHPGRAELAKAYLNKISDKLPAIGKRSLRKAVYVAVSNPEREEPTVCEEEDYNSKDTRLAFLNKSCVKVLYGLGQRANPYLLELTAMLGKGHAMLYEALFAIVTLAMFNPDLRAIFQPQDEISLIADRSKILQWGREGRYLADWICPHCNVGYDMHIGRGCMEHTEWLRLINSYVR